MSAPTTLAVSKSFTPDEAAPGEVVQLTIVISNPVGNTLTGSNIAFTDVYPAGMVNATPCNASSTSGVVTAVDGGGQIALTGGSASPGNDIIITVDVFSHLAGAYVNSTGTVTLTGASVLPTSASATLTVIGCPFILLSGLAASNIIDEAISETITPSAGTAPITFAVTSGSLPTGRSLAAGTGVLSGTPTALGSYNFTITATDANGCTGARAYHVNVVRQSIFTRILRRCCGKGFLVVKTTTPP